MEDEDKNSKSFGKPCGFESHHRHSIIKQLRIERFWAVFLFLLSFLYFGVFWEDIDDCIRRGHLTGEIQMCINVACCADVTVTEPLLNLLQAHAIGIEQTGTTMAQIVKADTLHLVCDQKIREMLTQKVGPNPLSHRVYIDIVKIIGAIAFAADLPILLLLLFIFLSICSQAGIRGSVRQLDFVLVRSRATSIITPSTFPVPNQHQKAVIRGFDSIIHPLFRDANYAFAAILEIFY